MSNRDHTLAAEKARADEYAELWQRIVAGGWIPGDKFCTSQGVTWQFRETPYTSEFSEVQERHGLEQTHVDHGLRWKSRDGRPAGTPPRLMSIARTNYTGRVPRPSAPIGAAFNINEKEGVGSSW